MLNQILGVNNNQTIKEEEFLEITANSVRLQNEVYQLRNVTGFGVDEIKTKGIPLILPIMLLIISFISLSAIGDLSVFGVSIILVTLPLSVLLFYLRFGRPKLYGLFIYLNSGRETVLLTEDIYFLRTVIRTLKEFIENPNPEQIINVKIGRDMKGNITFGNVNNLTVK